MFGIQYKMAFIFRDIFHDRGQCCWETLNPQPYLEGQGDSVSSLIMGITGITIWVNYGVY